VNSYPSIKQSFGILGIAVAAMIILLPLYLSIPDSEVGLLIHYTLSMGATIALSISLRNKRHGVTSFDSRIPDIKIIPWILIAAAGVVFGISSPLSSLIPLNDFFRKVFLEMAGRTGIFTFATVVIAAPVMEEILFRGIILDGFLKRYGPAKAITVSALLFGFLHLNPWQFVSAFCIGILMGWIYYRTGSLALVILIHFANNFLAFVAMKFTANYEELIDQSIVEYYGGLVSFLSVIGVSLTALAYSIYELDRRMVHNPPKNEEHSTVEGEEQHGTANDEDFRRQ
jgi:uncharacterized protein